MLPFGATCTRITSPHFVSFGPFMLAGSVGQSGTRWYGFGSVGLGTDASRFVWLCAAATNAPPTRAEIANCKQTRLDVVMVYLLESETQENRTLFSIFSQLGTVNRVPGIRITSVGMYAEGFSGHSSPDNSVQLTKRKRKTKALRAGRNSE